jgi:hypothetical protein
MKPVKRNPVVLNTPPSVAALILFCRHVLLAMTNNAWFPNPDPPLATVSADVDALEVAETAARTRAIGTAKARDLKKQVVEDDLTALRLYVHLIALRHPEQAEAIIASSGMAPKQFTRPQKADLAASMGTAAGEVVLRAKAAKRRAAYEWEYSADGGKTYTDAGATTTADTSILGLTVGVTYLFRVRITLGRKTGDWCQPIAFTVH